MHTADPVTDHEVLFVAAEAASLAPSLHNSQPWRFELDGSKLNVFADLTRWLPATDASGRELVISCGAAICFAHLALRGMGRNVHTQLLPDPDNPDHLARLTLSGRRAPSTEEKALIRALPIRYTDRDTYDDRQVPPSLVRQLHQGVRAQGAWLREVATPGDEVSLAVLLAHADDVQRGDRAYAAELADWTRADDTALDGVLRSSVPHAPSMKRSPTYRLRDFFAEAKPAELAVCEVEFHAPSETHPTVVLIETDADDTLAWLTAGQALGWLLLRATADGVTAEPMTQILELPATRAQLRHALRLSGHPQMLLRLGYGTGRPRSHRRPVAQGDTRARERAGIDPTAAGHDQDATR